jgi:hypothetical protein
VIRIPVKRGLVLSLNGFIASNDRQVVLHDHFRQLISSLRDELVSGREIVQFGWANPATRIIINAATRPPIPIGRDARAIDLLSECER